MKVRLNIDYTCCRDGVNPESFQAGAVVDFPLTIAATLLDDGRAVEVAAPAPARVNKMAAPPETKPVAPPAVAATPPAEPAQTSVISPELRAAVKANRRNGRRKATGS